MKKSKIQTFTSSKEDFGWMGNMCGYWKGVPLVIQYDFYGTGTPMKFNTSENLFQALRFGKDSKNRSIVEAISKVNGYEGKQIAKDQQKFMVVERLSDQDVINMFEVVKLKLKQYPFLLEELNTISKDTIIVEDVSKRMGGSGLFWGAAKIENSNIWIGQNILGKIYTSINLGVYDIDNIVDLLFQKSCIWV